MGHLIDTCVWIDVEPARLAPANVAAITGQAPVYLSPATLAELQFGAEMAADAAIRLKRLAALRRLQRKPLQPIDGTTGEVFGRLAASLDAAQDGRRAHGSTTSGWPARRSNGTIGY